MISGNFSLMAALMPLPMESGPVYLTLQSPASTETTSTLPPKFLMAGLNISKWLFTTWNSTRIKWSIIWEPLLVYNFLFIHTSTVVSIWIPSTWHMSLTASPNFSFRTRSIPIFIVVVELGQLPQAPAWWRKNKMKSRMMECMNLKYKVQCKSTCRFFHS